MTALLTAVADKLADNPAALKEVVSTMAQDVNPVGAQALAKALVENPANKEPIMQALQQANPDLANSVQKAADAITAVNTFNNLAGASKSDASSVLVQASGDKMAVAAKPSLITTTQGDKMAVATTLGLPAETGSADLSSQIVGSARVLDANGKLVNSSNNPFSSISNASPKEMLMQLSSTVSADKTLAANTLQGLVLVGQEKSTALSLVGMINAGKGADVSAALTTMIANGQSNQAATLCHNHSPNRKYDTSQSTFNHNDSKQFSRGIINADWVYVGTRQCERGGSAV